MYLRDGRLLALVILLIVTPRVTAEFKAGVASEVITPEPLLPVSGGLGAPNPVTGKQGDLYARALFLQQGQEQLVIVSLDVLGFPSVLCDRIRRLVPDVSGSRILVCSSHTHSAPDCYAFPDGKGGHTGDLNYMQFVCEKAADAIRTARNGLRPASLRVATGEAKGRIAYNYYAPDLYDRRMSVLQAVDPSGSVIASLVNYATHPEVLGNDVGLLSPDLVGPLRDRLEERIGGVAMFVNGAQGGMVTADNRDLSSKPRDPIRAYWNDHRTWSECIRIGNLMADEAIRILSEAPLEPDPTLRVLNSQVRFPVESETIWNIIKESPLGYPHNPDRSVTTRVDLIQLGTARILSIPGEAMPNIGFYLKRKMDAEHTLLFGLTNDAFGYILTEVDYNSFPRYDYVTRTSLGEYTGEILIDTSLRLIRQMNRLNGRRTPRLRGLP